MKPNQKDFFAQKAKGFDGQKSTTQNVDQIAQTLLNNVAFTREMHIMDFGSGTGLLLSQVAPFVGEITAVDISKSMTEVLKSKVDHIDCKLNILEMDLTTETLDTTFDAIISSMTIHHIEHVQELFHNFYSLLKDGGLIAIADLDKEDGTFHSEDTGIFHLGFDRDEFLSLAKNAGFGDLKIQTASMAKKPTGSYPIFLLTGKK